ncbi:MAG TPA: nuclear transport factor 2 family protein [Thermodesulfobacteriota bacterium]|nr:nuclear transport factor 2 family protein [Thermodesulfobacteriota bacterium]
MNADRREEVLKANAGFYRALRSGNLESMREVWLNGPEAKCVHPGWPMLYGWEAVKESWKNIFHGGPPADIEISDERVYVSGELAWVICIEKISQTAGGQTRHGYAQATNVFELRGSSWRLVIHHASPVPMPAGDPGSNHNLQ